MTCSKAIKSALQPKNHSLLGPAQTRCGVHYALQDWLQFEFRAADDAEYFGCCRLLLQNSASSPVRCCSASNNRTFSIAMTA